MLPSLLFRTQVDDIVTKRTSHQKLHRKVIYLLCACLVKLLLSCNPVVDNHILDRIGHSLEYLLRCRLVDRSAVLVLYIFDNTLLNSSLLISRILSSQYS